MQAYNNILPSSERLAWLLLFVLATLNKSKRAVLHGGNRDKVQLCIIHTGEKKSLCGQLVSHRCWHWLACNLDTGRRLTEMVLASHEASFLLVVVVFQKQVFVQKPYN